LAAAKAADKACPLPPHCDVRLQIADVPGRGRGLVVTSSVAEGELLLVSQAMVMAPASDLKVALIKRLERCSQEEYERFMCLQDGAGSDTRPASSFDSDLPSWTSAPRSEQTQERDVDSARVERVLECNALTRDDAMDQHGVAQTKPPLCGLWLAASLVNHSCLPNVTEFFLGDLLVLRAVKYIEAGQELLMSYVSTLQPRHVRQKYLADKFSFSCSCIRCCEEGLAMEETKEQMLLERLDSVVSSRRALPEMLQELESLAHECRSAVTSAMSRPTGHAFGDANFFRASFLPIFMGLAFARKRMGEKQKALEAYVDCTELLAKVCPGSLYHLSWSLEAALQAHLQADARSKDLAMQALRFCYRFAAPEAKVCEGLASKAGWPKDLIEQTLSSLEDLTKVDSASSPWKHSLDKGETFISVAICLPEGIGPADVTIDLASERVRLTAPELPDLLVALPCPVNLEAAAPAKYKRNGRKLMLQLPLS